MKFWTSHIELKPLYINITEREIRKSKSGVSLLIELL